MTQGRQIRQLLAQHGITGTERLPHRLDLLTKKQHGALLSSKQHGVFRSVLQQVAYFRDTRPEISVAVGHLQRQANSPLDQDLRDLGHLLRYLNAAPDWPLVYQPKDLQLRAWADGAFANHADSRSTFGLVVTLGGEKNAPIVTKSGTVKTILRSATETEINSVNEASSEALWAYDLLTELGFPQKPIPIYQDNESCILMMQRAPRNFQTSSKHVRIKWSFFRQQYRRNLLYLEYCPTENMRADLLTKPLGGVLFRKHSGTVLNSIYPIKV